MLFTALAACIIIISQRHYNAIIISHFQYKGLASFSAGNVVCDDDYYYYYYQQYLISVIKNYSVFAGSACTLEIDDTGMDHYRGRKVKLP